MDVDALLLVSFGGPEGPAEVLPFLRRVTAGRGVPEERLAEVAGHYDAVGGVSPINAQNRELLAALRARLDPLPVYWGNRNSRPFLADTLRVMGDDGVGTALAFVTSAAGSYSSCRQYLDDIATARADVGPGAPVVHKLRLFYNHPGFIEAMAERVREALGRRSGPPPVLVFTAHSVPRSMADGSDYVAELTEAARLVAERTVPGADWQLVWQSRSGPPAVPWLEPDVNDQLARLAAAGCAEVLLVPIGFVSDHMEVLYDLDTEAADTARRLGLRLSRSATVGTHPAFVEMVAELVAERVAGAPRRALGDRGPSPDPGPAACFPGHCPAPTRPGAAAGAPR